MTEMEFLKEQETHLQGCISMHAKCLDVLKQKLAAVQKLIAHIDGQAGGADCPTNQSCGR